MGDQESNAGDGIGNVGEPSESEANGCPNACFSRLDDSVSDDQHKERTGSKPAENVDGENTADGDEILHERNSNSFSFLPLLLSSSPPGQSRKHSFCPDLFCIFHIPHLPFLLPTQH